MQLSNQQRILRARTFNEIAELYDKARREPPEWIYECLFASTGLDPAAARILEIGCGTGKSTLPLARRGCHIVALEKGENLAHLACERLAAFPRVHIVNTSFEDWAPAEPFDLALAITAWHWLDPGLRYPRAAAALRQGGFLAFTQTEHVFPHDFDPFFQDIQDAYEAIGVGRLPWPPPTIESIQDSRAEILHTGLFDDVRVIRRVWCEQFTADEHVAMMLTASDHRLLEPAKREWLFGEMRRLIHARPEGRVVKHNLTLLHLARKRCE